MDTNSHIDLTLKGGDLVPRLKSYNLQSKDVVVRIQQYHLNAVLSEKLETTEKFLFVNKI